MSTIAGGRRAAAPAVAGTRPRTDDVRPVPLQRVVRFELVKLLARWPVRAALAACWLAPALFVAVIGGQSSLPTDTVFGRWLGQSGWAGPLVVLAFACSWLLPLLVSLVAGDVFASEDRLGTWRHLLVAVRAPHRIFAAKLLASLVVIVLLVAGLALSACAGGLLAVGSRPLPGLDGHLLATGDAARTVALAWLCVLGPTLAFAAVGLLGSVALGRSPFGLAAPAVLALLLQVAQLLPLPVAVRTALPSSAFLAWRGLLTDGAQTGPLLAGLLVGVAWAVLATALALRLFVRRDFTDLAADGLGRRALTGAVLPLAALLGIGVGAVAAAAPAGGTGIRKAALDGSLATSFGHLYVLQTRELRRPAVTTAQLRARADCDRGGAAVADTGPGNDWRCVVTWRLPGSTAVGTAIYQLDVRPDGRYVADGDGPQPVNGFFPVPTPTGAAPNPLWQFDGLVDVLAG